MGEVFIARRRTFKRNPRIEDGPVPHSEPEALPSTLRADWRHELKEEHAFPENIRRLLFALLSKS